MNSVPDPTPSVTPLSADPLKQRLGRVKWLLLDVDGVLTDGRITLYSDGTETKSFHIADGLGMVVLQAHGVKIGFVTGRKSAVVNRRAVELGVSLVRENVKDKGNAVTQIARQIGVNLDEIAFMGDDWNDLPAFALCGVRLAPANAAARVKAEADYVCTRNGGQGAVREVCELLLEAHGITEAVLITDYLNRLCAQENSVLQATAGQ